MTNIVDDVRAVHRQMADDLTAVGPDAPSGTGDWSTADLAAHLLSQSGAARFALAAARLALARGMRPGERAGPSTNERAIQLYKRRDFDRAVEAVRAGPPFPLLRATIAPVALFEIWVHNDDLRRANQLGPGLEPESLADAVAFMARYQRSRLGDAALPACSNAELMRWLTGRPCAIPPHDPPLTI